MGQLSEIRFAAFAQGRDDQSALISSGQLVDLRGDPGHVLLRLDRAPLWRDLLDSRSGGRCGILSERRRPDAQAAPKSDQDGLFHRDWMMVIGVTPFTPAR